MLEESDGTRPPFRHIPCVQWVRLAGGRATRCKRVTRRAGTANITHCTPASCGVRLVALVLLMSMHTQKPNYAATQGLPRHRQVSEAIYATACLSALSTQCIFRKGCVCIKNACSKPGAGKTPAGVRSYAKAFYGAHSTQYISRSRCACITNASASQGLEDSGRCQKLCLSNEKPARGWGDTVRRQKL